MKLHIYAKLSVTTGSVQFYTCNDDMKSFYEEQDDYVFIQSVDIEMCEEEIKKACTPGAIENLKNKQAELRARIVDIDTKIQSLLAIEHLP